MIKKRSLKIFLDLLQIFWILNFILFLFWDYRFHGGALSGSLNGGHYFLDSRGTLTEVSPGVWLFSLYQGISNFFTFGAGILAAVFKHEIFDKKNKFFNRFLK
jgi:hypothetical protein